MNKLQIIDYFDTLKANVDISVELYIADNRHNANLIDLVNEAREKWITEIKECLEFNISHCKEHDLEDEVLFKRFCFLIEFHGDAMISGRFTRRLVSTDMFLRPGQIQCFQEMIKFIDCDYAMEYIKVPLTSKSLQRLFKSDSKLNLSVNI
jgi:hypothetical protein